MAGSQTYHLGVLRQWWDDATRTYTAWDAAGVQTEQRPYTAEENAAADTTATAVAEQANTTEMITEQDTSVDKLVAVVEALNAITARTNATINANPAATIKDIAREVKTIARVANREARLTSGRTESTHTGTEAP